MCTVATVDVVYVDSGNWGHVFSWVEVFIHELFVLYGRITQIWGIHQVKSHALLGRATGAFMFSKFPVNQTTTLSVVGLIYLAGCVATNDKMALLFLAHISAVIEQIQDLKCAVNTE